jgi:hypothetical protein
MPEKGQEIPAAKKRRFFNLKNRTFLELTHFRRSFVITCINTAHGPPPVNPAGRAMRVWLLLAKYNSSSDELFSNIPRLFTAIEVGGLQGHDVFGWNGDYFPR